MGHLQKSLNGSESMCRSIMASSFQSLKKCSSFKKSDILMAKMPETCDYFFGPPKPSFFVYRIKKTYIHKLYAIYGLTFMPTPRTFEKVVTDLIRPNVSKNLVKKCKQIIFLTPFWCTSKNQRLDLKVWADPSWLLVLKNCLKKVSSLINDWVIDI